MVNTVSREKRLKKWLKRYFGMSVGSIVFNAVNYLLFLGFAFCMFYPFWYVVSHSLRSYTLIDDVPRLVYSFKAYVIVFGNSGLVTSFLLSVGVVVAHVVLHIIVTMLAAYPLSKRDLRGRTGILLFITFTMLFSGGLIPYYILLTKYLHLKNNLLVYILPSAFNVWNMFLLRNFFNDIPEALVESAKLEGASEATIAFRIVIPLSLPALATIGLFSALAYWNEWMASSLYMDNEKYYLLQYHIVRMVNSISAANNLGASGLPAGVTSVPAQTLRLATAIVTIGPIVLLYPFLQKYFVAGLRVGGVKG